MQTRIFEHPILTPFLSAMIILSAVPALAQEQNSQSSGWQRFKSRLAEIGWFRNRNLEALPVGNGRVELRQYDIASKIPGRVKEVRVSEGDIVSRDQLLVRLDSTELKAQRQAYEAQVEVAERTLAEARALRRKAEAELDLARSTFRRLEELRKQKYVSQDQFEKARTTLVQAEAALDLVNKKVELAAAQIKAAHTQLDVIDAKLSDTLILSPVPGRVLKRYVQPGEVIAAGAALLSLVDPLDVYLDIFLTPKQLAGVKLHQPAEIVVEGWKEGRAMPAEVVFVSPEAQFTPKFVETEDERAKLSFRVRLAVEKAWLRDHGDEVFGGIPAVARILVSEGR